MASRRDGFRCFYCNEEGHIKKDCPKKKDDGIVCYNCNEKGHFKRNCPKLLDSRVNPLDKGGNYPEGGLEASKSISGVLLSEDDSKKRSFTATQSKPSGRDQIRKPLPPFVDTHCHLEYVFERYEHSGSFSEFTKAQNYPNNFDGCITSFCDPAAFSNFGIWSELLGEPESKVWGSFGIHPHNAKYYHSQHLEDKIMKCIEHERCVAFGEIGLDYGDRSPSDHETQKKILARQLQLTVSLAKPLLLHCRDAEDDLADVLFKYIPNDWKIHLHCFTGRPRQAFKFLDHYPNLYIGVTGNVTYENARNVRSIVEQVPLDRLLVETDAPYNTPRNLPRSGRCRFSHPAHAYYAAKEIGNLKNTDLREVLQVIRDNTRSMYGI